MTVWREGYRLPQFKADVMAGLTVAIVALPLSMAIAIASGVTPERGLYTAIVGGFLVSALGGSRFQIGGPAGAFIVLVAATVAAHGVDGLMLATMMAGVILLAVGLLRLGTYIKYIPYPVTVGFTAGIAVIIFAEPDQRTVRADAAGQGAGAARCRSSMALGEALPTRSTSAAIAGRGADHRHHRRRCGAGGRTGRAILIAVGAGLARGWLLRPAGRDHRHALRRHPAQPAAAARCRRSRSSKIDRRAARRRSPSRCSARIESAAVGRGRRRHDRPAPPLELRAGGAGRRQHRLGAVRRHLRHRHHRPHRDQCARRRARAGLGHAACAVPAAVHAGGRAAGQLHPARGACRRAGRRRLEHGREARVRRRCCAPRAATRVVLLATFLLVVFRDLTEGIVVGFALGALLFMHRMAKSIAVEADVPLVEDDVADTPTAARPTMPAMATDPDIVVYRISGAFFFGAAVDGRQPCSTASPTSARPSSSTSRPCRSSIRPRPSHRGRRPQGGKRAGVRFIISGASPQIRRMLFTHGVRPPHVRYKATIKGAVEQVRREKAEA